MPEIDILIGERAKADDVAPDAADEVPEVDSAKPPVTREGDIWEIGKHRLICGNALDPASYERLLRLELAQMVSATRHTTCR